VERFSFFLRSAWRQLCVFSKSFKIWRLSVSAATATNNTKSFRKQQFGTDRPQSIHGRANEVGISRNHSGEEFLIGNVLATTQDQNRRKQLD
jgi:hypothetical protein